ncbi:hypothetical protein MKW94_029902 [Papaver nudicaule]|uniref:Disease resistance R13L4/SHOC-2-like LRR domain-containing protein n=1 Tax=Papaver nudicaule TaxID=74823 RepID=A0AA42B0K9_PAPNU|nr:hypothetical protein [Papaver nudicaule]
MRELALRTSEKQNFCTNLGATDSRLDGKVRRLSMYNSGRNMQLSKSMSNNLRSFFFFETELFPFSSLHHNLSHFKLLRVLDLQGVSVETLPGGLFSLVDLRYLNLRDSKLREIPKSIGSLQNLQTLDIRNTNVQRIPNELTKLSNLRHLYMYSYKNDCSRDFNFLCTIKAPLGIWNLHSLQTLACLEADEHLVKQVGSLCELRRFQVTKLRACDGPKLCASIEKMNFLRYLGVMASNEEELLQLEDLSPPTPLQKLTLVGHLLRLPPWLSSLMNLTHLYLGWSRLSGDDDILSSLQVLSNLVFLELKKAYEGELLQFHAGFFPKLNKLNLWELTRLKSVIIDEGALPSIRFLHLIRCEELKGLPTGIEHLATLEKLHLQEMPQEFVQELQRDISEDRRNVRRISTVKHVFSSEHNCVVETLLY